jgi:hypothetical protein
MVCFILDQWVSGIGPRLQSVLEKAWISICWKGFFSIYCSGKIIKVSPKDCPHKKSSL